ncbi:hypothetical protein [Tenacibaculum sp. M341]|uniref:hypothetical protein n=1 Tax=Tenacibaculum sp. M341 TaxID=2530339 RepID=UPI001046827A|nr:hypothetical protein [Tenacibaculum sp. M341]TCI85080.1 hypothetical protein EYW44_18165 [Tenacibaculum sp. M341]
MRVLYKNKKKVLEVRDVLKSMFINVPVSAVLISLFYSLLTWSKPEFSDIMRYILYLEVGTIIIIFFSVNKKRLKRICIDHDNQKLLISQFNFLKFSKELEFDLNSLKLSEIKHMPISSFAIYNFFLIENSQIQVKIKTSDLEFYEFDQIYEELKKVNRN